MRRKGIILIVALIIATSAGYQFGINDIDPNASNVPASKWDHAQALEWQKSNPWFRGSDFIPSNAINQLEAWQAETFDPQTIDRELGWAQDIGFNCMRVFLHHVAWETDKEGFKSRIDQYLSIANKHGIKTIFVFFDDCWNPNYKAGKQPDPKPGMHNSGWLQDPGALIYDEHGIVKQEIIDLLEKYVKDIMTTFAKDQRIAAWDLYNEPGNSGYINRSMPLLKKVFEWARQINPSQPLTSGVWNIELKDVNKFQLDNSDIITYHNYGDEIDHKKAIDTLKLYDRPMVCTEYMARTRNSRFENIMPLLKANNIGAINWGLVSGKSNTIYEWDKPIPDGSEPKIWFHNIFRSNGIPYDQKEIDVIKSLTAK